MSAFQNETDFLRQIIVYDDTDERHTLEERITEIQRSERCIRCAVRLMVLLIALAIAGLGYSAVFLQDFPGNKSHVIIKALCVLGLGSLISLLMYMGYWLIYRKELDRRHEECRRLVAKLLESRLGKPGTLPLPEGVNGEGSRRSIAVKNETARVNPQTPLLLVSKTQTTNPLRT